MTFAAPHFLYGLLILPALLLLLLWGEKQRERSLRRFVASGLSQRLSLELSPARRRWKEALLIASVALAIVSLARPQWGYRWEDVKRRGVDIIIAVDVSKSMLAGDVSPSRLERAKRKIEDLLAMVQGDRIGLIAFSGKAFVLTPLTLDYGAIGLYLDSLSPDLITAQGTNVGDAVTLALKSLKQGDPHSQSLLLMTDGEDLSGDALEAAGKSADQGVKIYALGIGTDSGAPIPAQGGGFKKDSSGEIVLTKIDESTLRKMTEATGGIYARSVAGDGDLSALYGAMRGKLEERDLKSGKQRRFIDRFGYFLLPTILLLLAESLLKETKSNKRKKRALLMAGTLVSIAYANPASAFSLPGPVQEGERLYRAGQYEGALQQFLEAQKSRPNDARLQYNIGSTYYELKRYEDAQKMFDTASKDKELRERSLYNRGNSQFRKDQFEDAIRSYEEALTIDPKDEDAHHNLELAKRKLEQKKQQDQEQKKDKQENQKDQKQENPQDQPNGEEPSQDRDSGNKNQDEQNKKNQEKTGQGQPKEPENKNKQENNRTPQPTEAPKPGEASQDSKNVPGQMTAEEAERWLSTLQEGRRRIIQGRQNGKTKNEKDW